MIAQGWPAGLGTSSGSEPSTGVLRARILAHSEQLRATSARLGRLQAETRWESAAAAAFSADLSTCLTTALLLAGRWDELAAELPTWRWP